MKTYLTRFLKQKILYCTFRVNERKNIEIRFEIFSFRIKINTYIVLPTILIITVAEKYTKKEFWCKQPYSAIFRTEAIFFGEMEFLEYVFGN